MPQSTIRTTEPLRFSKDKFVEIISYPVEIVSYHGETISYAVEIINYLGETISYVVEVCLTELVEVLFNLLFLISSKRSD